MKLNQGKLRQILRWMHLILGAVIMCYIYSPFNEIHWFQILIKWLIVPVITISGIWIWKFQLFNRFFNIK